MLSVPAFFVGGLGPTSNVVCCLGDPSKVMMGSGNGFGWRARRTCIKQHLTASKWFAGAWELVRTYVRIRGVRTTNHMLKLMKQCHRAIDGLTDDERLY